MNKKALLTVGLSFVLLLGLVALSWAAVQPQPSVAIPGAERTVKHHPNKAAAFVIQQWDFETQDWSVGMPGEPWHSTTKRVCSADSAWWNGIDQFNGYASDWRNYMDTDQRPVADSITLQWNHMWSIERGILVESPYDAWDIAGLQIAVNGGPFYPLDAAFPGWFGYLYTRTRSFAYGHEWNIGDYYGGWEYNSPGWPGSCVMSGITLKRGDQPFESHYSTYAIQSGDQIVFRFEFCSDPAYASDEGDPVEGWYVDDIALTSGATSYTNSGSNQGATLQMHPGNHIFPSDWLWVTDNYSPHEYKSATHSWWVRDTTVNGNSWLISPWIELPDSAKLVWIDYYQDQFSPGAIIGGYPADYYYWYVRPEDDMRWRKLTWDWDHLYDSTHCDWDVNWRFWEDDSLYNGTFFAVPDKVPFGSRVQFAIKSMTDTLVQYQGKQECTPGVFTWHDARGLYIDDFAVWGQKCYDQNMGLFWETQCSRAFPFSVPAGSSCVVKMLVRSMYACDPTAAPTEVDADVVNTENWWTASTTLPTGYPADHDTLIEIGTFTATQSSDTAQTFEGEVVMAGDNNLSDNTYTNVPAFNFFVTDKLSEYLGYDDQRMKTAQRGFGDNNAVGVWFEPVYNWGGYKLLDIRWLSAYQGSTHVKIYYPVTPRWTYNVMWPPTVDPSQVIPCPVDTGLDLSGASVIFDTLVHVPKNDWKYLTFYDDSGVVPLALRDLDGAFLLYLCWEGISPDSVGGCGFDGPETVGGHTFMGHSCNPTSDSLTHHCNYDKQEPWQDASVRASVGHKDWVPPSGEEFIRADYDGDGAVALGDVMDYLNWFFEVPGNIPPTCNDACDYNDDSVLSLTDIMAFLNWFFEVPGNTSPVPPYPDCGPDPTPDDGVTCEWHAFCMGGKANRSVRVSKNKVPLGGIVKSTTDTLYICRAAGALGATEVVVPVTTWLDTTGNYDSDGYVTCFEYDTLALQADSVTWRNTDVEDVVDVPWMFETNLTETKGKNWAGVVLSAGAERIPAGKRSLLNIFFTVLKTDPSFATDSTIVQLLETPIGSPPKRNELCRTPDDIFPAKKSGIFYFYLPGDADRNGQEEMEDAFSSFGYLYEGKDSLVPVPEAIDANEDGYQDISDVMRIAYDVQGKRKGSKRDIGHPTLAKTKSATQGYGRLKVVCSGPRNPGDTMHVVIVAEAAENYPVEAMGIGELLYPACLRPIRVSYYGKAAQADTAGWSYKTTPSNNCNDSDKLSLGILFSFDGYEEKFLQPEEGERSLAQIDFEIDTEADNGVYPISIPPEPPEIRPVFSVLGGSRHEPEVEIVDSVRVGFHPDEEGLALPKSFALAQNYPNPFNPLTQIKYALPKDCYVRLEVYNILGQKVATLVDGQEKVGYKTATWDAKDMASGIYFYRLEAGEFTAIKKMVLLK